MFGEVTGWNIVLEQTVKMRLRLEEYELGLRDIFLKIHEKC